MHKLLLVIFSIAACGLSAQVTPDFKIDVLHRVVPISGDSLLTAGSAFLLTENGKNYLVTAKHVFLRTHHPKEASVRLFDTDGWKKFNLKVYYSETADVAVMGPITFGPKNVYTLNACEGTMRLGETFYFLGFPYQLMTIVDLDGLKGQTFLPYVKRGILSGFLGQGVSNRLLVLDALNNPGFSGGPVVSVNTSSAGLCVDAVAVAYEPESKPVYDENHNETKQAIEENSGLMVAVPVNKVLEVIHAIPVESK